MHFRFFLLAFIFIGCTSKKKAPAVISYTKDSVLVAQTENRFDSIVHIHRTYNNLSRQFKIEESVTRYCYHNDIADSTIVDLHLYDKKSKTPMAFISQASTLLFSDHFNDSGNVLSYSTGVNINKEIIDNYYGDIVVADLNFDNRDDIVLISDVGGNGGSFYRYYLQHNTGEFFEDHYLSDSMTYFPTEIKPKLKTLTTYVHAGVCCLGKHVYALQPATGQWKQIKHVILGERKAKN